MLGYRLQRDHANLVAALNLAAAFHGAVSLQIFGRKNNLSSARVPLSGTSRRDEGHVCPAA
jgi:hypothetical protein